MFRHCRRRSSRQTSSRRVDRAARTAVRAAGTALARHQLPGKSKEAETAEEDDGDSEQQVFVRGTLGYGIKKEPGVIVVDRTWLQDDEEEERNRDPQNSVGRLESTHGRSPSS